MAQGIGAGIAPSQSQQAGMGQQMRQSGAGQEPAPNVSPEEQAAYDQFMENAFQIIMAGGDGSKPSPSIIAHLQGQFEPELQQMLAKVEPPLNPQSGTDNLAATTVLIVLYLQGSAMESGKDVPGYIVFEAGHDISDALAQMVGLDEQSSEMAFYRACDMYRQVSPFVDQEELAQEFGQFVEAEKSGALDQAVPGLRQKIEGAANG